MASAQSRIPPRQEWDENRRKHERVRGESLPKGAYENIYTWDNGTSKHAANRNERAAREFDRIEGDTRPGDDWEYAGQTTGRAAGRGKDGGAAGRGTPATGIWTRKKAAPQPKAQAPAAAPEAAPQTPAYRPPAAPAFNPASFAAPAQTPSTPPAGSGGSSTPAPEGRAPGATAPVAGSELFDSYARYSQAIANGPGTLLQPRMAGSPEFAAMLQQQFTATDAATGSAGSNQRFRRQHRFAPTSIPST